MFRGLRAHALPPISIAMLALASCSADLGGTGQGSAVEAGVRVDAGLDAGPTSDGGDGLDAGDAALLARSCDGVPSGSVETQPGYRAPLALPPALCEPGVQSRTCVDGSWSAFSGDYPYASCTVQGFADCDTEPHGSVQIQYVYTQVLAASASACAAARSPITRACNDGTWSAWSEAPPGSTGTCAVQVGGGCASQGELAEYACVQGSCAGARCVLENGGACTQNVECAGTCVAGRCAAQPPVQGVCDDSDDCSAASCSSGAQCWGGQCLCNDGSACGGNTACVNTCRGGACAPRGGACDATDPADCVGGDPCYLDGSFWICVSDLELPCNNDNVCQVTCVAGQCALRSKVLGACDNDDDCEAGLKCANAVASGTKACLREQGAACADGFECTSGSCSSTGGGYGVCQ
jgi:hypothetical protein